MTTPRLLHPDQREAYVKIAERLYSSYARDPSGPDPRVFFTAAVAVLLHYPLEVAAQVNDPFWGLPGKSPHLPTPYDNEPMTTYCGHDRLPGKPYCKKHFETGMEPKRPLTRLHPSLYK